MRRIFTQGGSKDWPVQFVQHVLSGGVATITHYFIMWVALSLELLPVMATTVGFLAGATVRFFFSYFHIFEPERDVRGALPHFILSLLVQLVLNAAVLATLLTFITLVWPAQIATTIGLTILNFLMYKYWVFK